MSRLPLRHVLARNGPELNRFSMQRRPAASTARYCMQKATQHTSIYPPELLTFHFMAGYCVRLEGYVNYVQTYGEGHMKVEEVS